MFQKLRAIKTQEEVNLDFFFFLSTKRSLKYNTDTPVCLILSVDNLLFRDVTKK